MTQMHAAVVTSFDQPPHYQQFDAPRPSGEHETLVEVERAVMSKALEVSPVSVGVLVAASV